MDALKRVYVVMSICFIIAISSTYIYLNRAEEIKIEELKNKYDNILYNLSNYVNFIENKNNELEDEVQYINDLIKKINNELDLKNISLQQNISELEKLRSGNNYTLHDPTYDELVNFIENDKTEEEIYIEGIFDCEQFSQKLNTNAEDIGIRCAYVIIYFYDTDAGHGIVGFNTVDQGMVYIEPQSDEWVENLKEGNDYWTDCIIPNGNYYYEESQNDTIREILLFW